MLEFFRIWIFESALKTFRNSNQGSLTLKFAIIIICNLQASKDNDQDMSYSPVISPFAALSSEDDRNMQVSPFLSPVVNMLADDEDSHQNISESLYPMSSSYFSVSDCFLLV